MRKLLTDLYNISAPTFQETDMQAFVSDFCKGAKVKTDKSGNIYVTKGKAKNYPCIVAHLDEVHDRKPVDFKVYSIDTDTIFGYSATQKFVGIGADDKNGIWIALQCFQRFDNIKLAFFVAEESGCIGSGAANMQFFQNTRFVLQCDRKGAHDFINNACGTELCSNEFLTDVAPANFNFAPARGAMTDVFQLKENGLNVSCANISCGYYNPHTENEFTVYSELLNTLNFVFSIIENCTDVYPHKPAPKIQSKYFMNDYPYKPAPNKHVFFADDYAIEDAEYTINEMRAIGYSDAYIKDTLALDYPQLSKNEIQDLMQR